MTTTVRDTRFQIFDCYDTIIYESIENAYYLVRGILIEDRIFLCIWMPYDHTELTMIAGPRIIDSAFRNTFGESCC